MSDTKNNGMMQVCGLWKNKDKEGRTFLSGNLNASVGILIFLNGFKSDEKQPDYRMYYVQREQDKKPDASLGTDDLDQPAGQQVDPERAAAARGATTPPTHNSNGTPVCAEDDIPFDPKP